MEKIIQMTDINKYYQMGEESLHALKDVNQAVEKGEIPRQRHESYCAMYQEIKDVKQWQQRNKNV